jgi:hypothetical protein
MTNDNNYLPKELIPSIPPTATVSYYHPETEQNLTAAE